MVEKEQKIRRIHRILIILIVVLAGALFLELWYEWPVGEQGVGSGVRSEAFEPEITLTENESGYTIRCPLPGVRKDRIEVSMKGNYLSISAVRGVAKWGRSRLGAYERRILLPGMIDERGIRAEYKDGVLVISLPKRGSVEEWEPLKVQVI